MVELKRQVALAHPKQIVEVALIVGPSPASGGPVTASLRLGVRLAGRQQGETKLDC